MEWLDTVLQSALPLLIVMSVLAVALPFARPTRPWTGVGLALLIVFVAGLATAAANTDSWTLDCVFRVYRTSESGGAGPANRLCTGANDLSPWLLALPPGLSVAVLLAWVGWRTRPFANAMRTALVLLLCSAAAVAIGQVNPNLGLLLVVILVVGSYGWTYVRDEVLPSRQVRGGT